MSENEMGNNPNTTMQSQEEPMATLDKTMEYKTFQSKQKKKKGLYLLLGILIVAVIGILIWYFVFRPANINVYERAVRDFFGTVKQNLNEAKNYSIDFDYKTDVVALDGNIDFDSSMEELDILSAYSLGFDVKSDAKNEKYEVALSLNDATDTVLDGTVYMIEDQAYIASEKLYDGLLSSAIDSPIDMSNMPSYTISTYQTLVEKLEDVMIRFIKESEIRRENITKEIDGQSRNVTDHIFTMTGDDAKRLVNDFATTLLSDEAYLEELARFLGMNVADLRATLEEMQSTEDFGDGELTFHLYTEGKDNMLVAMSIYADETEALVGTFNETNNIITFLNTNNGDVTISYNDTEFKLSTTTYGEVTELVITRISENEQEVSFTYPDGTLTARVSLNKESDTAMKIAADLTVSTLSEGEIVDLAMNVDATLTVGNQEVANIDTTNAIDANSLTEEQSNEILMNLMNILMNEEPIYNLIYGISTGSNPFAL